MKRCRSEMNKESKAYKKHKYDKLVGKLQKLREKISFDSDNSDTDMNESDVHQDNETHDVVAEEIDKSVNDTYDFLGTKPGKSVQEIKPLHEELVIRWQAYLQDGISKEQKQSIFDKYSLYENCPILQAPDLGPELMACLDAKTWRQDKFLTNLQIEAGHTLTALGSEITTLLNEDSEKNKQILTVPADASQLVCNTFHSLSTHRKYNIIPFIKSSSRKLVEKSKSDEFLLGKNFVNDLKASETAKKTGMELKAHQPRSITRQIFSRYGNTTPQANIGPTHLNYKRPIPYTRNKTSYPQINEHRYKYRNETKKTHHQQARK
nr:unnamed protein product [Callosobruchus analis]